MAKPKIRITVTYEYEPDTKYYPGTESIEDCIKVDKQMIHEIMHDAMVMGKSTEKIEAVEG